MTDETNLTEQRAEEQGADVSKEIRVAEVVFILFLLGVTVAAILESFTYSMTAARTPLVILIPLLLLIIGITVREIRVMRRDSASLVDTVKTALRGKYPKFQKFLAFALWLILLMIMVAILGHYVAVALFTWILMRPVGKETNALAIKVALGVPLAIFGLFDLVLGLEMFPGLIYQVWAGYDVF